MILTNVNTHYSLLLGYGKPDQILKQCANLQMPACAITDYNSLSGAVNFYKNAKKNKVKPIIGSRINVRNPKTGAFGYLNVYAKNKQGWFELIKLCSSLYLNDEVVVDIDELRKYSNLAYMVCGRDSIMDAESMKVLTDLNADVFVGIDNVNKNSYTVDNLKGIADTYKLNVLAAPLVAYSDKKDKFDHLTLFSSHLKITSNDWAYNTDQQFSMFEKGDYSIPLTDDMYSALELDNLNRFNDLFEDYSILEKPSLPSFPCPDGLSEAEYLRVLCREGWKRKINPLNLSDELRQQYVDQVNKELAVIGKAGLDGYFLIVQDYVNWAKNQGWLIGPGRGSAGGCLVSYLTNITSIDPIKYGLLFERFYNEGRNTADHISFPDIDVDFPVDKRDQVIEYIRKRYGDAYVSQVITLSSLQGRGAFKEVLRIHNVCDSKTMDEITKKIPQRDKISDRLEEDKETSVLRWVLKYEPKVLGDYCKLEDNGEYTGQYAQYVKQAVDIESTFKSFGKHASALVISKQPMNESCPMIREKSGDELICSIEYTEMEDLGKAKMDILGVANLTKLMGVNKLLRTGKLDD